MNKIQKWIYGDLNEEQRALLVEHLNRKPETEHEADIRNSERIHRIHKRKVWKAH